MSVSLRLLRALVFAVPVSAWLMASLSVRVASLRDLAALVWLDQAIGDLPVLGWAVDGLLGGEPTLAHLYASSLATAVLGSQFLAVWLLLRAVDGARRVGALTDRLRRPGGGDLLQLQQEQRRTRRATLELALLGAGALALAAGLSVVDWWSVIAHGAWRITVEETLASGHDPMSLGAVSLPPLDLFLNPGDWALEDLTGDAVTIDLGAAPTLLRLHAWGQTLGLGWAPALSAAVVLRSAVTAVRALTSSGVPSHRLARA